jgi:hypothetical protein
MSQRATSFEVVYYPQLVISNPPTLTILGLLCDRIWLPGVHLPSDAMPVTELDAMLERAERFERDPAKQRMWAALRAFLEPRRVLKDLLVLTGEYGYPGKTEPEAQELARALEEAYFGPPSENFIPMIEGGFALGTINGPGVFTYPANAFAVAMKQGLPLVTDNPFMPVPMGTVDQRNAPLLAMALAIEAVGIALRRSRPSIRN